MGVVREVVVDFSCDELNRSLDDCDASFRDLVRSVGYEEGSRCASDSSRASGCARIDHRSSNHGLRRSEYGVRRAHPVRVFVFVVRDVVPVVLDAIFSRRVRPH